MATKEVVYRKIGECIEFAQLLEAELGNWLASHLPEVEHLFEDLPPTDGSRFFNVVDRDLLFQLLDTVYDSTVFDTRAQRFMLDALDERNRLMGTFFVDNKTEFNTERGRMALLIDLEKSHRTLEAAYDFTLVISEGMVPTRRQSVVPPKA